MRAVRLLEHAITKNPEWVLDVGVGKGMHAFSFLAQGFRVTGIDVQSAPLMHPLYDHLQSAVELVKDDRQWDMVWCCHTLEHIPNTQSALIQFRKWLKDDGWLYLALPTSRQNRLHIGHLTLWTPAHLIYNLICAGWNCKEALWYTEYATIGLALQKKEDIDYSGRTGNPDEIQWLNQYTPIPVRHEDGAWWGNRWPDEFVSHRIQDPPGVTIGLVKTNLKPEQQLAYGPNPKLRKEKGGGR